MDSMGDSSAKYALLARNLSRARRPRWTPVVSSVRIDLARRRHSNGHVAPLKVPSHLDLSAGRDGPIRNYAVADTTTIGHGNGTARTDYKTAFGGTERRGSLELARDAPCF